MKHIAVLGSTGSIGRNTLEVIRNFPGRFRALALSANSNTGLLSRQINGFRPRLVCVRDEGAAARLAPALRKKRARLFSGERGLDEMVRDKRIDMVVLAVSGAAALPALLNSIDGGKDIALANKEALIMAGPIIKKRALSKGVNIIPIDSEQSAIWQCLRGEDRKKIKNIYLTASGGPFRNKSRRELRNISVREALKHPRWSMGPKISVDSANLMNKGLEVLEAVYLFGIGPERIKVIIHPQAIIHSMVEFQDGVVMAQMSVTDMRIPIQYALTYPERFPSRLTPVDFFKIKRFDFYEPDIRKFPCLGLAYRAAEKGGTHPAALNAANEACVDEFLKGRLAFLSIPGIIEKVLEKHRNIPEPSLEEILEADRLARSEAYGFIHKRRVSL